MYYRREREKESLFWKGGGGEGSETASILAGLGERVGGRRATQDDLTKRYWCPAAITHTASLKGRHSFL